MCFLRKALLSFSIAPETESLADIISNLSRETERASRAIKEFTQKMRELSEKNSFLPKGHTANQPSGSWRARPSRDPRTKNGS
jgi:hypothetical protein